MEALRRVLAGGTTRSFQDLDSFWASHVEETARYALPIDRAFLGGSATDRLGYAFAAGYAAAVQALFGSPREVLASLAASEEAGAHPKGIRTTLTANGISGHKKWITLAGEVLFVLARTAESLEQERPTLKVVRVFRDRAGVRVIPQPETPFVPEVPHAEVEFEDVEIAPGDVLPGDGWSDWVKPFRTVEDLHVHAALLGFVIANARRFDWPKDFIEGAAGTFAALRMLAKEDLSAAQNHVALAGAMSQTSALLDRLESLWPAGEDRERWERDRPLLSIARKARSLRIERAWSTLGE